MKSAHKVHVKPCTLSTTCRAKTVCETGNLWCSRALHSHPNAHPPRLYLSLLLLLRRSLGLFSGLKERPLFALLRDNRQQKLEVVAVGLLLTGFLAH